MSTEHIGFRCPSDLVEAIREASTQQGVSVTQFVVNALRVAVGQPTTVGDTQSLNERLTAVEQRLALVESVPGKPQREG
jgi:hypothetical protein